MLKSRFVITLLFVAIGAPYVRAGSISASSADAHYKATFTNGCTNPTPGCMSSTPTAPIVTFPSPTLTITWDDGSIILPGISLPAADAPTDTYQYSFAVFPEPDPSQFLTSYDIYDLNNESNTYGYFVIYRCKYCFDYATEGGNLTFAYVATPEPSSVALMLAGTGFLLVLKRKALAQRPLSFSR
jgi:hypothetical protein